MVSVHWTESRGPVSLISASHGCLAYRLVWVEPPDTTPLRRREAMKTPSSRRGGLGEATEIKGHLSGTPEVIQHGGSCRNEFW